MPRDFQPDDDCPYEGCGGRLHYPRFQLSKYLCCTRCGRGPLRGHYFRPKS